ncbi:methyltransferase domain-containing protein [Streptomyces jumonjinensis]|uniref:Class I SAM-dependent methyltransferase n=1 Tax=Streptomyces jumonjinensis TaxID=1945 RepID=A0A646KR26_STRJU|nr:class I SAM-dependent methyltransferase [Streptomyces jumonjinensis]
MKRTPCRLRPRSAATRKEHSDRATRGQSQLAGQAGSLDLVVCRNVLPSIDHQRFVVDTHRWLRPGGQLCVLVRV